MLVIIMTYFVLQNATAKITMVVKNPEGDLQLRGTLSQSQSGLSAPLSAFVVQNKTAQTVAYVDNTGNMFITGTSTEQVLFE